MSCTLPPMCIVTPDRDNMMPAAEPQTGQGAGERRALCTRTVQGAAPLFTEQASRIVQV